MKLPFRISNWKRIKPREKTGLGFEAIGLDLAFRDLKAFFAKLDAQLKPAEKKPGMSGDIVFSEGQITFRGNSCTHLSGSAKLEDKEATLVVSQAQMFGGRMQLAAQGQVSSVPFPVKLNLLIEEMDLGLLSKSDLIPWKLPLGVTGKLKKVSVDGILQTRYSFQGQSLLEIEKLSASDSTKGRNLVKDVSLHGQIEWLGKDLSFKGDTGSGPLSAQFSGTMKDFVDNGRSIQLRGVFPEIEVAKLRETFWDVFPDSLLYVGLNGSVSLETIVDYRQNDFAMSGSLTLKDLSLEGENGEYAIGPVNGIVPIAYRKGGNEAQAPPFPSFEKSQFDRLIRSYSKEPSGKGLHKLSLGSFRYGFQLLEDIQLWVEQKGSLLHVEQFSANIFGGRLAGSATVDLSNGIQYRAGLLIKGLSLTALCNSIPPIKGFISGRLDGIASLKGDRTGLSGLMGMGDFWTYEAGGEKTIISKEFLQKLGSQPAMQIYLRDRPFNKGTMSVYLKDGFLVFRELEISNRNFFGIKDLSVSVAPLSNRIAFDHLLSTVAQAAERVKQTNQ
jgi:hypothetical protein